MQWKHFSHLLYLIMCLNYALHTYHIFQRVPMGCGICKVQGCDRKFDLNQEFILSKPIATPCTHTQCVHWQFRFFYIVLKTNKQKLLATLRASWLPNIPSFFHCIRGYLFSFWHQSFAWTFCLWLAKDMSW